MGPGEETTGNEAAQEVQADAGQAGATEVAAAASQTGNASDAVQVTGTPTWKIGDTTYSKADEMAEAFRKFYGKFTQTHQEAARLREENKAGQLLMDIIRSDPRLLNEVQMRMNAGATKQQAVQQTAQAHQNDPALVDRLNAVEEKLILREQDMAQEEFRKAHPDVNDSEWSAMAEWLADNAEAMEYYKDNPKFMIEMAWNQVVLPKRFTSQGPKLLEQGQRMKEEEIKKGKQSAFLGSQAPTAGAKSTPLGRPKGKLTDAQERAYAYKVWEQTKGK